MLTQTETQERSGLIWHSVVKMRALVSGGSEARAITAQPINYALMYAQSQLPLLLQPGLGSYNDIQGVYLDCLSDEKALFL